MTPNESIKRAQLMTDMERSIEKRIVASGMTREQFWDWYLNPGEEKSVRTVEQDGWTTYCPNTININHP